MNNLKGLFVFSLTNMIERFGFYAMMSIMVLSFMEERGYDGEKAGYYYSVFYSSSYIAMLFMGLVGDLFNRRKIISIGMISMVIGYFFYYFMPKENDILLIIPGIFIILGLGAFKTNLQVQVGDLYRNNIKNGTLGYLVFYSFINLGAVFAPGIAIFFRNLYGIDSVFLLSGGSIIVAFILYNLVPISIKLDRGLLIKEEKRINILSEVTHNNENSENVKYGSDRIIGLIFLIFLVPFFWVAFHQNGLVFTFYVKDFIDLNGYAPETIQAINPIAYVLFSIVGILLFFFLVKFKNIHSILPIIGIGMLLVALGYFIPSYGLENHTEKLSYSYAIVPMLIITLGELFISPFLIIGFYHYSPIKVRGLFMGLFMVISAVGNMFLFLYASDYDAYGAASTFDKIVFHVLISAISVFIVWLIIKRISNKRQ
jgi:POT family proton-dependent oligopeptide transporter